jgi:outer membrane protein insertion porin family
MQKLSLKIIKLSKIFIINFVIFLFLSSAIAEIPKNFEINGNKTVSKETILNYLGENKYNFNLKDLNELKKNLFKTNYFSEIDIEIFEKKIVINLVENPMTDFFFVEGIKNKKLLEEVNELISLKYNTFFSESFIKKDVIKISSFLSSKGYFDNAVTYVVKKINGNRVNIFYDVLLNQKFKVGNVFFIGNKNFSSSTLSEVISTSQHSWLSFFSNSSIPSSERSSYDKSLLKNFFLDRGYYDIQVSDPSFEILNTNFVNLVFVVNSGNRFKIEKINLTNNAPASISSNGLVELKKYASKLQNKYYNPKNIENLREKISQYLGVNKIPAFVDINLIKSSDKVLILNVSMTNESEQILINKINISGNNITQESVIRNNIFFTEGDRYGEYFFNKSLDNLNSLQFFKNIKIEKEKIPNSKNVNVNIKIDEIATGEISAGAGYGSEGALLSFNFKEKNYLGQGLTLNVNANLSTQKSLGSFGYVNPDFLDSGISFANNFYITESSFDNSGYENKSIGWNSRVTSDIYKNFSFTPGFELEYELIDPQPNATALIKSQDGNYLTTKFFYTALNDQRSSKFKTKEGYTLGFRQGLATFFTDSPFLSNELFGDFYRELHEDFIGTIRYKISSINSLNNKDIKLSNRLFLSDNYLRGFEHRGYGPIHSGDHIGGNYLYAASFGTSIPNYFPDKWGVSTNFFLDTGNLWGADLDSSANRNHFRSSLGTGLSWVSPLGPLSITYAEPISKASSDKINKFNFRIGTIF